MTGKEVNLKVSGFWQASGVAGYCALVGLLFWQGSQIFGHKPNYLGPVAFLLLFIVSALICALMVFYRPYKLFFGGEKDQAAKLVLYTTGWLFSMAIILLVSAVLVRLP